MRLFLVGCLKQMRGQGLKTSSVVSLGDRRAGEFERAFTLSNGDVESAIDIEVKKTQYGNIN